MTRLSANLQEVLLELLGQLELRFLVLSRPLARACSRHNQLVAVLGAAAELAPSRTVSHQQAWQCHVIQMQAPNCIVQHNTCHSMSCT